MQRFMLKSKIHRATVTDADLHYEGSISIDEKLMEEASIAPYEKLKYTMLIMARDFRLMPSNVNVIPEQFVSMALPPVKWPKEI